MQWPWWMSIQYFYSFTGLIQTVDWWSEIDLGSISCNVTFFLFCYSFPCVFFKTPTFNPFTSVLTAIKIFTKDWCWRVLLIGKYFGEYWSTRHFVLFKIRRILAIHENFDLDWLDSEQKYLIIYFVRIETIVRLSFHKKNCYGQIFSPSWQVSWPMTGLLGVFLFFWGAEVCPVLNPHWKHPTGL